MPPQCLFGTEICGNARKKPHLTPSQRTVIIAKHKAGASLAELASEFGHQSLQFTTPSNASPSTKQQAIYLVLAVLQDYQVVKKNLYTEKHMLLQRLST
jgi:hypothetical protein